MRDHAEREPLGREPFVSRALPVLRRDSAALRRVPGVRGVGLALMLLGTGPLFAQCPIVEEQVVERPGAVAGDEAAFAVSLDGDQAVVGVRGAGRNGEHDHGTVFVYRRSGGTWTQTQELHAADGQPHDRFGQSLCLRGDRLIVGAPEEDDGGKNAGAAYVFSFDGNQWSQEAKLVAPDPAVEDQFGTSVAVRGDVALVGAPFDDEGSDKSGAAFVYRKVAGNWVFEQKLLSTDASAAPDQFGYSVSLSGVSVSDTAAFVGAPLDNGPAFDSGAVFVFRDQGGSWAGEAKVFLADGKDGDTLGHSVAADGERFLTGVKGRDGKRGSAVFFRDVGGGVWALEQEVTPTVRTAADLFGSSVALHDDEALVGAPGAHGTGAAISFRRVGGVWEPRQELLRSNAASDDQLGFSVAIANRQMLAGAPYVDRDAANPDIGAGLFATSTDLSLVADPRAVAEGEDLTIRVCHGAPSAPVLLFAVGVGKLAVAHFDAAGEWSATGTIPPGTAGLKVEFFSIGIDSEGDVAVSNVARVEITP